MNKQVFLAAATALILVFLFGIFWITKGIETATTEDYASMAIIAISYWLILNYVSDEDEFK